MTSGRYGLALRQIGRLLRGGSVASLGTGELLERFASDRDEAAFEALIYQHGPMVLGTCRRMLADPHDVDDAFQATFLVLARRAGSIQDADRLGPWLHGVARRVASRSRALSARRQSLERSTGAEPSSEPDHPLEAAELRAALDEELASLPDKYRAPLVLCYLEGLTHDEAAQRLRWPVGTVRSRLAGGRDRLRDRLSRRGLAPASSVPAFLPQASIPQALVSTTLRVATSAGSVPAQVASLAKGVLVAMFWNKLKLVGALCLTTGLTVGGAGIAGQQAERVENQANVVKPQPTTPSDLSEKVSNELTPKERLEQEIAAEKAKLAEYRLRMGPLDEKWWTLRDQDSKDLAAPIAALEAEGARLKEDVEIAEKTIDILKIRLKRLSSPLQAKPDPVVAVDKPAERPTRWPSIQQFEANHVLVIPPERDRATVINTETGRQTTQMFPPGLDSIVETVGTSRLGLVFRGPEVRRVAVFNLVDDKWYPHDLKEPATVADPIVGQKKIIYQLGRFLYVFSNESKKWAVLELKNALDRSVLQDFINGQFEDNRLIVPEGNLIHVYNGKTGEWTHNDTTEPDEAEKAPEPGVAPGPAPKPPAPQPVVHTIPGRPALLAVISAERDRVTMINVATQERETLRLPQGVNEIVPIVGSQVIGLMMKGPLITRVGFYDRVAKKWFEHDLKEPATEVNPILSPGASGGETMVGLHLKGSEFTRLDLFDTSDKKWTTQDLREPAKGEVAPVMTAVSATYRIGRFLYIYSAIAKKWSVLELKPESSAIPMLDGMGGMGGGGGTNYPNNNGKIVISDGDLIHIYEIRTGDWTHIDIKDDK